MRSAARKPRTDQPHPAIRRSRLLLVETPCARSLATLSAGTSCRRNFRFSSTICARMTAARTRARSISGRGLNWNWDSKWHVLIFGPARTWNEQAESTMRAKRLGPFRSCCPSFAGLSKSCKDLRLRRAPEPDAVSLRMTRPAGFLLRTFHPRVFRCRYVCRRFPRWKVVMA